VEYFGNPFGYSSLVLEHVPRRNASDDNDGNELLASELGNKKGTIPVLFRNGESDKVKNQNGLGVFLFCLGEAQKVLIDI